jgi:hypothetical protein
MAAVAPCKRVRLTGTVEIDLRQEEAFLLFTPTGERAWARGWNPEFPSQGSDDTEPGTVFRTEHDGRESIWTVIQRDAGNSIGYVMTTPGDRCGLIAVACQPSAQGTRATVSYDLTALNPGTNEELDRFAANYASFLGDWERAIAEASAVR